MPEWLRILRNCSGKHSVTYVKATSYSSFMSVVNVVVIRKGKLGVVQVHWRLLTRFHCLYPHWALKLDEGYVVVDFDAKCIFSKQQAVSIPLPKDWSLVEV